MLSDAVLCLALAVFFEARSEPLIGQKAVAQVVMNRAGQDPDKVCDVVFKPYQFSAFNPGYSTDWYMRKIEGEPAAWDKAKVIAGRAIEGRYRGRFGGANHYHTRAVKPRWNRKMVVVAQLGDHVFWKGSFAQ